MTWFYCESEEQYFEDEVKRQECMMYGHRVVRRIPTELRTIHGSSDETEIYNLNVDGQPVTVLLVFHFFKGEPRTNADWHVFGNAVLQGSLDDVSKHLDSAYLPDARITRDELLMLIENSIKQGTCDKFSENSFRVNFCLDSDLRKEPRNQNSKWTTCSNLTISRLGQKER